MILGEFGIQNQDNTYLSVSKLMLFGILYTPSHLSKPQGNQLKALVFYHLLHPDNSISNIDRTDTKLKFMVKAMFELC